MSAAPGDLRVAILGSGPRGLINAELLEASGIGRVTGFWDRTTERAEAAASRFGAIAAASAERVVAESGADVAAILTHPAARSELVAAAVAGGARAIVIEKPVALDEAELRRVEQAAGAAFVVVNTQYQWMPHWAQLLDRIRAGELGEIRSIRGSTGVDILEQGPHVLGLCLAAAAAGGLPDPAWVLAAGEPGGLSAVFGLGGARLSLLAGTVAPLVPGETVIHFQQQVEVIGSRGRLWVSLNRGADLWIDNGADTKHESFSTEWPRDDTLAQTAFYLHVQRALDDAAVRDDFPTRLTVASAETRLLFAAVVSARDATLLPLALVE